MIHWIFLNLIVPILVYGVFGLMLYLVIKPLSSLPDERRKPDEDSEER